MRLHGYDNPMSTKNVTGFFLQVRELKELQLYNQTSIKPEMAFESLFDA